MKILLVSVNNYTAHIVYPLGMSVVAKVLSDAGYEVKQFDFLAGGQSYEEFEKFFNEYKPDIVTISIRNFLDSSSEITKKFINIMLSKKNDVKIILGGSGFSVFPDKFLEETNADYGFVGQAEDGFVEFINNIVNDKQKEKIFYSKNNNGVSGALYDSNLLRFYKDYPWAIGLSTKRGCKYRCLYCQYKKFDGNNIKYRDVDSVISDIKYLKEQNIENINFTDSVFNDDSDNHIKVLENMLANNLNINWYAFIRPKLLNEKTVILMKKTGLHEANIAIDASTDETLIGMQKDFSWSDVEETVRLLKKYDICVGANIIFGGPNETENTLKHGIRNVKELEKIVNNLDIKIFFGREDYNPVISTGFIEQQLKLSFGEQNFCL